MKHTPKPWEADDLTLHNDGEFSVCIWGPDGTSMGRVGMACGDNLMLADGVDEAELYANARVMAAAPDLLEACEQVMAEGDQ